MLMSDSMDSIFYYEPKSQAQSQAVGHPCNLVTLQTPSPSQTEAERPLECEDVNNL